MTTTAQTHPFAPLDPGALTLGDGSSIGDDTGHTDAFGTPILAGYAVKAVVPTTAGGHTIAAATVVGWGEQFLDLRVARYRGADGSCVTVPRCFDVMALPLYVAMLEDSEDYGVDKIGATDALGDQLYDDDVAAFVLYDDHGQPQLVRGEVQGRWERSVCAISDGAAHPTLPPFMEAGQPIVSVPEPVMRLDV